MPPNFPNCSGTYSASRLVHGSTCRCLVTVAVVMAAWEMVMMVELAARVTVARVEATREEQKASVLLAGTQTNVGTVHTMFRNEVSRRSPLMSCASLKQPAL